MKIISVKRKLYETIQHPRNAQEPSEESLLSEGESCTYRGRTRRGAPLAAFMKQPLKRLRMGGAEQLQLYIAILTGCLVLMGFLTPMGCLDASADAFCTEADLPSLLASVPEYTDRPYVDVHDDVPYFQERMDTAFDGYGPLDSLGRCTVAFACLGPETMPSAPREDIRSIKPSGWNSARYEGIDGKNLFNRCHLIGYQLTGQNENTRNLITGTRYMNTEGMLPFENSVADYIRETGFHVMYRVTPVFEGSNLVASGVLMEARSVEDPAIQFCAYCYNVQPGYEIDYATGENAGPDRMEGDGQEYEVLFPAGGERTVPEETACTYILNTNTKKFHTPSCSSVRDIAENNRREWTGTRGGLLAMGYEPCGRCRP